MEFDFTSSWIAAGVFLLFIISLTFQWLRGKNWAPIRFSGLTHIQEAGSSWRVRSRWVLTLLRILVVLFILIAFARPQKGLEVIQTAREGIAIQMIIDRSSSMLEPLDYQGKELDRLEVVKRVFQAFILGDRDQLKGRRNDMIGLTSFAGFVEENAPLTLDHNSLVNFARIIRPATRIEDGTMIGGAIYYSVLRLIAVDELLKKAGRKNNDYRVKSKVIILLTDGQQTQGGMNPVESAEFAKENNIKVYTIAIVSPDAYKRTDSVFGQFFSFGNRQVDTRLLEKVAAVTGGLFAKASSGEALLQIYQKIDDLEKSKFEERFTTYKEHYQIFVVFALLLLMLEITLSQTVFRKIP